MICSIGYSQTVVAVDFCMVNFSLGFKFIMDGPFCLEKDTQTRVKVAKSRLKQQGINKKTYLKTVHKATNQ